METNFQRTESRIKPLLTEAVKSMIIIVDSREQAPWTNYFKAQTRVETLPTGDYSIAGLTDKITIERKSLPDLISSLTRDRDRFVNELIRMQSFDEAYVIVEADYSEMAKGHYRSDANPNSMIESVVALSHRYCPFYFCGHAGMAARFAESLLTRYLRDRCHEIEMVVLAAGGAT